MCSIRRQSPRFRKIRRLPKVVVSKFFGGDITINGNRHSAFRFLPSDLMLSSIGTLHTSILTGARVPYAMAKDGLMFESIGRLSEATRVPVIALLVQGVWACLLALSGSFDTLTDYVIFGSWIFYALATSIDFCFPPKISRFSDDLIKHSVIRSCRFYFCWLPDLLLINTMINAPMQSFTGIILILLGLPVYYYLTTRKKVENNKE